MYVFTEHLPHVRHRAKYWRYIIVIKSSVVPAIVECFLWREGRQKYANRQITLIPLEGETNKGYKREQE